MHILIIIGIIILIIWGIIKLIIFLAPYIATGVVFLLGAGGVLGLVVGIFYGIKNYMLSIHENINSHALKITMMFITSVFILALLGSAVYFSPLPEIIKENIMFYDYSDDVITETFVNKMVDTDGLNVRAGPSADFGIVFVLYRNTIVKVSDKDQSGEWVKIIYKDNEGFVNQKFLKEVK